MKHELLAGLEIGSSQISCAIGSLQHEGALSTLGLGTAAHRGVRQGQVADLASLVEGIEQAVRAAEQDAGVEIQQAFVSVSHPAIRSLRSRGVLTLAERATTIRSREIHRVTEQAELRALSLDHELLHSIPLGFTIDDQDGIDNPAGLMGAKLAVDLHLVTLPQSLAQNIVKAVTLSGIDVEGLVYSGCATALATLTDEERRLGSLVIDLGGSTTDLLIAQRGRVAFVETLPWGGDRLTEAIARYLKVTSERSEQLKRSFDWSAQTPVAAFIRKEVAAMSRAVVETLQAGGWSPDHLIVAVVAGRSALLDGLVEHLQDALQLPVRIGRSTASRLGLTGERALLATTVLGLLEYGKRLRLGDLPLLPAPSSLWGRLLYKAQEVFQEYF
ncbi:MAG: cell division protein FtsA [Candidatus Omnitrophica bacterium]|nr:cell division protein FtsA [Candidatus Omnitrophota bacterium]